VKAKHNGKHRPRSEFRRGQRVVTKDGSGKIVGQEMRYNTNGGPGTRQFRVQLDDERIRHYTPSSLTAEEGQ
jgi:hypothetical protein